MYRDLEGNVYLYDVTTKTNTTLLGVDENVSVKVVCALVYLVGK